MSDSATPAAIFVYGLGRSGLAVVERARSVGTPVWFDEARTDGPDVVTAVALGAARVADVPAWLAHASARGATPKQVIAAAVTDDCRYVTLTAHRVDTHKRSFDVQ